MSVIEASSVKVATMADGTLRITADIEPRHAQAAFALFGSPGTPMALAALKVGIPAAADPVQEVKGGALAKSAGIICNDPDFQEFAGGNGYVSRDETAARAWICDFCLVESRRELDHNPQAARRYALLMERFRMWKKTA